MYIDSCNSPQDAFDIFGAGGNITDPVGITVVGGWETHDGSTVTAKVDPVPAQQQHHPADGHPAGRVPGHRAVGARRPARSQADDDSHARDAGVHGRIGRARAGLQPARDAEQRAGGLSNSATSVPVRALDLRQRPDRGERRDPDRYRADEGYRHHTRQRARRQHEGNPHCHPRLQQHDGLDPRERRLDQPGRERRLRDRGCPGAVRVHVRNRHAPAGHVLRRDLHRLAERHRVRQRQLLDLGDDHGVQPRRDPQHDGNGLQPGGDAEHGARRPLGERHERAREVDRGQRSDRRRRRDPGRQRTDASDRRHARRTGRARR